MRCVMSVLCLPFNNRFLCVVNEHVASLVDRNLRQASATYSTHAKRGT